MAYMSNGVIVYDEFEQEDPDPWPLRGGICNQCGQEYNNFSGRCIACNRPPRSS